jgi:hypothetical protein
MIEWLFLGISTVFKGVPLMSRKKVLPSGFLH